MKPLKLNLDVNKTYLVAVSYGPDSMALLSMLIQGGYRVEVAHINHKKRMESDQEAIDLKRYCDKHNVLFHLTEFLSFNKGNFQGSARAFRYAFFASLVHERKLDALLTAHHYDDHLETAYFQKMRRVQSPYLGIKRNMVLQGMEVIRPLIEFRKQTLLNYCDQYKVPYAIDASNESMLYSRNRIRKLLSMMKDEDYHAFEREVERLNLDLQKNEEFVLPYVSLKVLPIPFYKSFTQLQAFLYWTLLLNQQGLHVPVGKAFLNRIQQMMDSTKPNLTFKISKDATIYKSYLNLRVVSKHETLGYSHKVLAPIDIDLPLIHLSFSSVFHVPYPFIIRSIQPNDSYLIDGHRKAVQRLFIDWKVPSYLRFVWPIFTDLEGQILYIPRYREKVEIKANKWLVLKE